MERVIALKKKRENFLIFLLIFIILILIIFGIYYLISTNRFVMKTKPEKSTIVVIDCGHGGPDGGAVGADGTLEKDINLSLGFRLKEHLEMNGYRVVMTRKTDDFICDDHNASLREQNVSDLHNRLNIAESYKNAIFISLHMNQFSDARYWGSQLFYSPNHPDSRELASLIRDRLICSVQQGNDRSLKEMDSSVYIIYHATHPALLLECGFMSNPEELDKFKDERYQSQFAWSVLLGIQDYFIHKEFTNG